MNMQISKSRLAPYLFAGIAAVLLSSVAMAIVPVTGWFKASREGADGISTPEQPADTLALPAAATPPGTGVSRSKARCEECGVIESTRRVDPAGSSPAVYEITVRLANGSTRVLSDVSPANWRPGERTIFIDGGSQSNR